VQAHRSCPTLWTEGVPEIRTVWSVAAWLHPCHQVVANQRSEAIKRTRQNHGTTIRAQVALAADLAHPFADARLLRDLLRQEGRSPRLGPLHDVLQTDHIASGA